MEIVVGILISMFGIYLLVRWQQRDLRTAHRPHGGLMSAGKKAFER
jgi:hypothetical protein